MKQENVQKHFYQNRMQQFNEILSQIQISFTKKQNNVKEI